MPRPRGTGKGPTITTTIRLDADTHHFYKTKANEYGMPFGEYLRNTLVQGVIAENVSEIEARLRSLIDESRQSAAGGGGSGIPDEIALAIFTCEAMLTAIVEARDTQALYEAQERAKVKLKRLRGG